MIRQVTVLFLVVLSTSVASLLVHPALVTSQLSQPEPQLNKVIQDVLKAEMAGARPEEVRSLVTQLNFVIELEERLQNLDQQDENSRTQLLGKISSTLTSVDAEANQVELTATQRTFTNDLITYSLVGAGAVGATLTYQYAISLRQKYRGKRVLRMQIIPKESSLRHQE